MRSGVSGSAGSLTYRSSAVSNDSDSAAAPPPRFCALARSHSSDRKCVSADSRKVRKRPLLRSASATQFFSSSLAKKACVRSWASSGEWPRRRTNAYSGNQ